MQLRKQTGNVCAMKNYYVEGNGWFVVTAANKREAKTIGVSEYGRGFVRKVREATREETEIYIAQNGKDALRP